MVLFRPVVIAIAGLLSVAGSSVQDAASLRQAPFRSRTDAVTVNVLVKQGRQPVRDLAAGDFRLTDNGVEQTVDALSLERVPLDLTLVMTGSGNVITNRDNRAAYLRGLTDTVKIRQSLLPEDRLRAVWVLGEIRGALVDKDEEWSLAADLGVTANQGASVVDGLFYAMAWPVEPDRRHLVVAFTDGMDAMSTLEIEALPGLAAHSDAVVHAVFWATPADNPGLLTALPRWQASYESVCEAVRRTGGTVHRATQALQDLVTIIEDYRSSYVLQYTPKGTPAPGWHELRVRVTRPGRFDVRARQGYEVRRD